MGNARSTVVPHDGSPRAAAGRIVLLFRAVEGCSQVLRAAVDRFVARHGLGTTQLLALWTCGEAPQGVGQSDLAEQVGVSPAQASALVEQLKKRGLIDSHREAADRRRQRWTITNSGRGVLVVAIEGLAELARLAGDSLDEQDRGQIESKLNRLAAAVSRLPSPVDDANDLPRLRVVSPDVGDAASRRPHAMREAPR
jgi:DNA-binding MarR family transcriptional regulator